MVILIQHLFSRPLIECMIVLKFFFFFFGNCDIQVKLGSQYYFYMESQAALAIPDEDNCMVVYSSSQVPERTHAVIARCLGVPEHNVRVITRRVGGAFGGKAIKAMPVSILYKNLLILTFFYKIYFHYWHWCRQWEASFVICWAMLSIPFYSTRNSRNIPFQLVNRY